MADYTPKAGAEDFQMTGVVNPPGASIDGNMVGACYDPFGDEIALPAGYSFLEESQFVTRLVCPATPDATEQPDLIVGQKADADLSPTQAYLSGNTFTVRTIAPSAASITTTAAGVVPKLP